MQRKIQSNVLMQNCFLRDNVVSSSSDIDYSDKEYISLDEVVTSKGVEVVENKVPYHITPQYVNSFVDSSDYRRDPVNAVLDSSKRKNLGDLTGVQDIGGLDFISAQKLYSALKAKFEAAKTPNISADKSKEGELNG